MEEEKRREGGGYQPSGRNAVGEVISERQQRDWRGTNQNAGMKETIQIRYGTGLYPLQKETGTVISRGDIIPLRQERKGKNGL